MSSVRFTRTRKRTCRCRNKKCTCRCKTKGGAKCRHKSTVRRNRTASMLHRTRTHRTRTRRQRGGQHSVSFSAAPIDDGNMLSIDRSQPPHPLLTIPESDPSRSMMTQSGLGGALTHGGKRRRKKGGSATGIFTQGMSDAWNSLKYGSASTIATLNGEPAPVNPHAAVQSGMRGDIAP